MDLLAVTYANSLKVRRTHRRRSLTAITNTSYFPRLGIPSLYFPRGRKLANTDKEYIGQIEDLQFMEQAFEDFKPDRVIHVATYPNARMVKRNVLDATNNMVTATAYVLDLCVKHKVDKIVYASSSMVYGEFNDQIPTEEVVPRPNTLYGSYKRQGEIMCKIWNREYGLDYIIMRPSALVW
jgi:nucleoside-diphosphate-sugar epimerase